LGEPNLALVLFEFVDEGQCEVVLEALSCPVVVVKDIVVAVDVTVALAISLPWDFVLEVLNFLSSTEPVSARQLVLCL
jgi:hypothetical protein